MFRGNLLAWSLWKYSRLVRKIKLRRDCLPIGHNNTKHFLCPIRSRHPLEFLEIVRWESVPRGSFARTWKLSSRLFSRPDWLPLGLRRWKRVKVRLPFRVMTRCVQDRNRTLCIEVNTTFERPSVNMLPPGKCKTFKHYAEAVFLPYVINYRTQNVKRIDLVWDRYLENSLNQGTHEARGTGTRRRVCACITEWTSSPGRFSLALGTRL